MGEINQQAAGLHTGTNNNVSEQSEKIRGILFVLAAGICWGSIGPFIRTFNKAGLYSLDIVVLRSISTTIFLFLFLLVYDRRLLKIRLRDIWCFIGTGIVSMAFFNFCYFSLITISTLSVAAVMLYTAPVFVMILSAILSRTSQNRLYSNEYSLSSAPRITSSSSFNSGVMYRSALVRVCFLI